MFNMVDHLLNVRIHMISLDVTLDLTFTYEIRISANIVHAFKCILEVVARRSYVRFLYIFSYQKVRVRVYKSHVID